MIALIPMSYIVLLMANFFTIQSFEPVSLNALSVALDLPINVCCTIMLQ